MSQPDLTKLAEHYSEILKEIGADVDSEGLKETPLRAAKALAEMTEGSRMGTDQLTKMFKADPLHDHHIVADCRPAFSQSHQKFATHILIFLARGVRDTHSNMKVNVMHGVFQQTAFDQT